MTDPHDDRLRAAVAPPGWRNPEPAPMYDLVVIGGGTAGLVSAVGAAGLGARVALVERASLGGDCLNTGCVPSKALLRAARVVHDARAAATAGVIVTTHVDFSAVMASVRARRADLAPHDSADRLTRAGVDVFFGHAAFTSARTAAVAGGTLRFRRAVIATGSRPRLPPIPGLADAPHLTSETLFALTTQPSSLVIVGGGPIGCEMAQAFALLGTRVTLVEAGARVLPRDDPDASEVIARRLSRDGIRILTHAEIQEVSGSEEGVRVRLAGEMLTGAAILVAVGRVPVVDGLGLDRAGVGHGGDGIEVDARLRTANRRIYAAGDVCSRFQFTHAADAQARLAIQNALFFGRRRALDLVIPWTTFTLPEVAHVGPSARDVVTGGAASITVPLAEVDRAVIDDAADDGFLRVHHRNGRIVAATMVGPRAGELIAAVASAMRRGGSLAEFSSDIVPYPTLPEALRKAGDAYRRTKLTPRARAVLQRYFALTRRL